MTGTPNQPEPLDPAAIMVAHRYHRTDADGTQCVLVNVYPLADERCLAYRLADALQRVTHAHSTTHTALETARTNLIREIDQAVARETQLRGELAAEKRASAEADRLAAELAAERAEVQRVEAAHHDMTCLYEALRLQLATARTDLTHEQGRAVDYGLSVVTDALKGLPPHHVRTADPASSSPDPKES